MHEIVSYSLSSVYYRIYEVAIPYFDCYKALAYSFGITFGLCVHVKNNYGVQTVPIL